MYQLNPLLQESTVARRLVDKGIITDPTIIRSFKRKGWIPTKKKELLGLSKGADNMLRKGGYKPVTRGNRVVNSGIIPKNASEKDLAELNQMPMYRNVKVKAGDAFIPRSPYSYVGKKGIVPVQDMFGADIKVTPAQVAVTKWHEGREAARTASATGKRYQDWLIKASKDPYAEAELMQKTGMHMPGVMRDEYRLGQRLHRRHGVDLFQDNIARTHFKTDSDAKQFHELINNNTSILTPEELDQFQKINPMTADGKISRHWYERQMAKMSPKKDFAFRRQLVANSKNP